MILIELTIASMARPSWPHHDLDAVVLFISERAVHLRRIVEPGAVRNQERGIDLVTLDAGEQRTDVFLNVRLSHLQGQAFAERAAERNLVDETAVHAGNRHRPALAAAMQRLAEGVSAIELDTHGLLDAVVDRIGRMAVGLHADGIDARVRTAAAGHLFENFVDVIHLFEIDRFRITGFAGQPQPRGNTIDGDYPRCAEHPRALHGEKTDGSAAPDRNHIA